MPLKKNPTIKKLAEIFTNNIIPLLNGDLYSPVTQLAMTTAKKGAGIGLARRDLDLMIAEHRGVAAALFLDRDIEEVHLRGANEARDKDVARLVVCLLYTSRCV